MNFQDNGQNTANVESTTQNSSQNKESVLNIGISDFDNINPLVTKNKDIISLSTILYEPLLEITEDY